MTTFLISTNSQGYITKRNSLNKKQFFNIKTDGSQILIPVFRNEKIANHVHF